MSNVLYSRSGDTELVDSASKMLAKNLNDKLKSEYWNRMWNEKQYFTNIFDMEGLDNRISSKILNSLFFFGKIAVVNLNGKPVICKVMKQTDNVYGEFVNGEAMYIPKLEVNVFEMPKFRTFKINSNNAVIMKWNDEGIPPYLFLSEYLGKMIMLETATITTFLTSIKTHIKSKPNKTTEANKINDKYALLDPTTPFIYETSAGQTKEKTVEGSSGAFNTSGSSIKQLDPQPLTTAHMEVLKEYIRLAYSRIGRRIETSQKKERVIVSEQAQNSASFPILEREAIRNLQEGVDGINKLFNMNIVLYAYVPQTEGNTAQEGQPAGTSDTKGGE